MNVQEMMRAHPRLTSAGTEAIARCIEECFTCLQVCTACADACLGEDAVTDLVRCITLDLDCADVCEATGKVLSRQTAFDVELALATVAACADACRRCADECERHAEHHEHCRICAQACRRCAEACDDVVSSAGS